MGFINRTASCLCYSERGGRGWGREQGSDRRGLRSHAPTGGHIRGCTDKDLRLWSECWGLPRACLFIR